MTPELIHAALVFLDRADLKGAEASTFLAVRQSLIAMLPPDKPMNFKARGVPEPVSEAA